MISHLPSAQRSMTQDPFDNLMSSDKEDSSRRLLQDPNFHLVKVVHSTTRVSGADTGNELYIPEFLTVVTPALDPAIAEEVGFYGWSCISHLWGDPSTWIDWDDSGVVDGITGETIKVKVCPDKRKEMMGLLQSPTRYWWIDVFCARSEVPLVIMGDIYRHSSATIALPDDSCEWFYGDGSMALYYGAKVTEEHLEAAAHDYLGSIAARHNNRAKHRDWDSIMEDLTQWVLDHYEGYHKKQGADDDDEDESPGFILETISGWKTDHLLEGSRASIADFLHCKWMNRVWTLQELALPRIPYITPPWIKEDTRQSSASFRLLRITLVCLIKVVAKAHEILAQVNTESGKPDQLQSPKQILAMYQSKDPILACVYSDYRKLFELVMSIAYTYVVENQKDTTKMEILILNSFATSQRKALYPVDYVYGVLGIFGIDIPRLTDPKEIWHRFSEELRRRYPDIHVPDNVDLSKATKMEDVYGDFGFPRESAISLDVIDYIHRF